MPEDKAKQLHVLGIRPELAIFNQLDTLNSKIQEIIDESKVEKIEEVTVNNLSEAQVDLTPLQANFEALNTSIEAVKQAIENIPEDKEVNLKKVEELLTKISKMEQAETDLSPITDVLSALVDKVNEDINISLKIV